MLARAIGFLKAMGRKVASLRTQSLVGFALAMALSACATPSRAPYSLAELAASKPMPGELIRFGVKDDEDSYSRWTATLAEQRATAGLASPRTLLALSGGSDKGAFGAGVLNGWSNRGTRPQFDIVTGVSTGALIAPFAFLGTREDASLTAIYTGVGPHDVFRQQVPRGILGGTSVLDSKPLAALIARYATFSLIDRVASEHRRGRRLLVMTTNLDAQRGVIWDMGAIAASASARRYTLFRQILLASASIPGAFPPVLIESSAGGRNFAEMHVDGGTIGGLFVLPSTQLSAPPRDSEEGAAIYIIYNGQLKPSFEMVKPRTFAILSSALATVLGENDRASVEHLREFAKGRKITFRLCELDDIPRKDAPLFDTVHMRELYAMGMLEAGKPDSCVLTTERPAREGVSSRDH